VHHVITLGTPHGGTGARALGLVGQRAAHADGRWPAGAARARAAPHREPGFTRFHSHWRATSCFRP
jgi:hypothetical protein